MQLRIAVGEAIPLATVVSTKPGGSVAAEAEKDKPNNRNTSAMNNRGLMRSGFAEKGKMIARACFRSAHRITSGKPGRPSASSWERELICGRRGWLSKPFISVDASKLRKVIGKGRKLIKFQPIRVTLLKGVGWLVSLSQLPRERARTSYLESKANTSGYTTDMFLLVFLYPSSLYCNLIVINNLEARGVEPLSSKRSTQTSTCLSGGKV